MVTSCILTNSLIWFISRLVFWYSTISFLNWIFSPIKVSFTILRSGLEADESFSINCYSFREVLLEKSNFTTLSMQSWSTLLPICGVDCLSLNLFLWVGFSICSGASERVITALHMLSKKKWNSSADILTWFYMSWKPNTKMMFLTNYSKLPSIESKIIEMSSYATTLSSF